MTPFERITAQVQAQIPLVRAMEAALGKEVAHRLVREALDKANREIVAQRGSLLDIPTLAAEFAGYGERHPLRVRDHRADRHPAPQSGQPLRLRRVHGTDRRP